MSDTSLGRKTVFDSAKGIAIIGIFLVHNYALGNIVFDYEVLNSLIQKGRYGVEITFIVNAFFFAQKYDSRVRSKEVSGFQYVYGMICKTLPIYWLALWLILLFEHFVQGGIEEGVSNIIFHFLGIHAFNYNFFNSLLPGSGYIGVLYVTWFLYLVYCKFVDTSEKSSVGALAVLWGGTSLKGL